MRSRGQLTFKEWASCGARNAITRTTASDAQRKRRRVVLLLEHGIPVDGLATRNVKGHRVGQHVVLEAGNRPGLGACVKRLADRRRVSRFAAILNATVSGNVGLAGNEEDEGNNGPQKNLKMRTHLL